MSNYYPDSSRITQWVPGTIQGVVGGIPTYSGATIDVAGFGWSESNSEADNNTAFNAAAATSSPGDIISIPAGDFDASPSMPYTLSNRLVRGAGVGVTTLHPSAQKGFNIGSGSDYGNSFNPKADISSITKDSNVIVLTDGTGFPSPSGESTYRIARLYLPNEAETPIVSVSAQEFIRCPSVVVTGRSGNNLTLSQPMPSAYTQALAIPGAHIEIGFQLVRYGTGMGVEDLTIDGNDSGGSMSVGLSFDYVANCWAKNVKVVGQGTYGIQLYDSVNYEVRRCWVDLPFGGGGGSNHAGILCNFCANGLVEDNISVNNGPNIEINFAATGNIFSYNFLGTGILNCNHGAHNAYNLFEGNIYGYTQSDGYFGGESENTDFRNWMRLGIISNLKRFSRNRNIIGNIVGTPGQSYDNDATGQWGDPNIGNTNSIGTAQLSVGDPWLDWDSVNGVPKTWPGTLTTRTTDKSGVITIQTGAGADFATSLAGTADNVRGLIPDSGAQGGIFTVLSVVGDLVTFNNYSVVLPALNDPVTLNPSANGFQEKDLDVAATVLRKENYSVFHGEIPSGELVAPDVIPVSYAYASEPPWWSDESYTGPFPGVEPTDPNSVSITSNPAGFRWARDSGVPTVLITAPADGTTYSPSSTINFTGTAEDTTDGDISADIIWTSSIAGEIGTGASISVSLGDGDHVITASATDSEDNTGTDSITIHVITEPHKRQAWLRSRTLICR